VKRSGFADHRPDMRARAKRVALNAVRRARRAALCAGVDLTSWEGEFLDSVEQRLDTFGRAFGDPEKGAPSEALSILQSVKLREVGAKARGKEPRRGLSASNPRRAGADVIKD